MLDRLLEATRVRVESLRPRLGEFTNAAREAPPARPFGPALAAPGLSVVAEVKRRSPSAGAIAPDLDPGGLASRYERGGAAALSVLTEPDHFAGSLDDLAAARAAVTLPVLRKDFTLEAVQIWEARAAGADAVLLIVAALDGGLLRELLAVAGEAGLAAIVEAHDAAEVEAALEAGAAIVGVNNRNLATFVTDLGVAESVAPALEGSGVVKLAESGVSTAHGARRMAAAGYDAILVGEAAARSADPAGFVRSLREAGR